MKKATAAPSDSSLVSVMDLVTRVRSQRRNLGPRNPSGLLLDECVVALTAVSEQLHRAKARAENGMTVRVVEDENGQPVEGGK